MDLVYEKDGEWYFWVKKWSYSQGPFSSKREAKEALKEYAKLPDKEKERNDKL